MRLSILTGKERKEEAKPCPPAKVILLLLLGLELIYIGIKECTV